MLYPDLIWTAGGIIGGYLLIENSESLSNKGKWGVWVIFASFLFQVYWDITHPWVKADSPWELLYVTVLAVVGLVMFWCSMRKKKGTPTKPTP